MGMPICSTQVQVAKNAHLLYTGTGSWAHLSASLCNACNYEFPLPVTNVAAKTLVCLACIP